MRNTADLRKDLRFILEWYLRYILSEGKHKININLTSTIKSIFKEKRISSCQESEKYFQIPINWNRVLVSRVDPDILFFIINIIPLAI